MMVGLPLSTGLGRELGKKGTSSDITLYNRKAGDRILNVVEAAPEKFSPMLLSVSMAELVLLHVKPDNLDQRFAEAVLAADALDKRKGLLYLDGVVPEQVQPLVRGTVAQDYSLFEGSAPELLSKLLEYNSTGTADGPVRIVVDHSFTVRSVGTVVLGVVVSGSVRKYDSLELNPAGKAVTVKSIQMMDEEVQEAVSGDRVGLSLKGASPEEARRGAVLGDSIPVNRLGSGITFNKYSDSISRQAMLLAGTARTEVRQEGSELVLGRMTAVWHGERLLVYDQAKKPVVRGHVTV